LITRRSRQLVAGIEIAPAASLRAAGVMADVKVRVISARVAPGRMALGSARSPRHRPRASRMMDLPAPVSPVMTVRPSPKFHVEFGRRP
jgi:hypothetical protein